MKLIVSYYTNNLGTTDYFLQNLKKKGESYFYLRHPFHFEKDLNYSELVYYNSKNNTESIKLSFKKLKNSQLEILKNMGVNYLVSLYLIFKIKSVYGFGSFNIFSFLWLRIIGKKTVFWGVDYSRKRFESNLMNKIYLFLESAACIFSTQIISSSDRQEEARIKFHHLNSKKSKVINNGINEMQDMTYDFNAHSKNAFIYIGSITQQHGIINFIKTLYTDTELTNNIYIFGGGEKEDELKTLIKKLNNKNIHYFGRKSSDEIRQFIEESQEKLWGIAPYNDTINDHVYYGDSLKIREYLMYGIPYITSKVVGIQKELHNFGYRYLNVIDILGILKNDFFCEKDKIDRILEEFYWDNLFETGL